MEESREQFARVQELFEKAEELKGDAREAFLRAECHGDSELRARVESLLRRLPEAEHFLKELPERVRALSEPPLPEKVGDYEVLKLLGKGSFGWVYLARQSSPSREVAIKVLQPWALDSKGVRRFELEAQILGRLKHPGVAQVFEARLDGASPFIAMEYVEGQSLTAYVKEKAIDIRARLELFAKVCDAVEHAHQKGVAHRDLKPENILVDASRQPKVLDFGLARVLDPESKGHISNDDGLVGTVCYMSPEQANGDSAEVDTVSDVYTLGVILFELLAGKLPNDLDSKNLPQALRTIETEEPTRLASVDRKFRGDLDALVSKALEKEKRARIASVGFFGAQVRKYLRDEPLDIHPRSSWYQARKFARRNKTFVSLSLVALLVLVSGFVTTTFQYLRAKTAETGLAKELSESHAQRARLLAQRGRWRPALEASGEALNSGHPDVGKIRLERALLSMALDEAEQVKVELTATNAVPLSNDTRALALLVNAEIALLRDWDVKRAEGDLATAESLGLPPGESAYAKALLAERAEEALTSLEQALREDPFHHRAHTSRLILLSILGRMAEARKEADAMVTLFPEDPTPRWFHGLFHALNGELEASRAVFTTMAEQFAPEKVRGLVAAAEAIVEIVGRLDSGTMWETGSASSLLSTLALLGRVVNQHHASAIVGFQKLRCVHEAWRRLQKMTSPAILAMALVAPTAHDKQMLAVIRQTLDVMPINALRHSEGDYILALIPNGLDKAGAAAALKECLRSYEIAAREPGLLPGLHRRALLKKVKCETSLSRASALSPEERAEMARTARESFDTARRLYDLLENDVAEIAGEAYHHYELGRHYFLTLVRINGSVKNWSLLATHEINHGRPCSALRVLDEAVKEVSSARAEFDSIRGAAEKTIAALAGQPAAE